MSAMANKQKKKVEPVEVFDEHSMNAGSAGVPLLGYFLGNRKPLIEKSANILSTSLGKRKYESTDIINDSFEDTDDEDWKTLGTTGLLSQYGLKSGAEVVAVKTVKGQSSKPGWSLGQQKYESTDVIDDSFGETDDKDLSTDVIDDSFGETDDEYLSTDVIDASFGEADDEYLSTDSIDDSFGETDDEELSTDGIDDSFGETDDEYLCTDGIDDSFGETDDEDLKTPNRSGLLFQDGLKPGAEDVVVKAVKGQSSKPRWSLGQQKYESTDVIDGSSGKADDEDLKTLNTSGLLFQDGLKPVAEDVVVKAVKGQSSKTGSKDGQTKPEAKKGKGAKRRGRKSKSHKRKDQSDPTLAPWAVRPQNIPNDGQLRNKFGRTKQEVIELRRAAQKKGRDRRTAAQKEYDSNYGKKWREDNKEYVTAYDHLRHAEAVSKYTPEQVEESRLKGRDQWHVKIAKDLESNPVKGLRVPDTGEQLQKKCAVLTTLPPELRIDGPDCGLHIIVCARKSWRATNGEHLELEAGNQVILRKFINDFVNPVPVLTTGSAVWHGRGANDTLTWTVRAEDDDDLLLISETDRWNEDADRRFSRMFSDSPDHSTVVVVVRGIDGASINVDSWIGLQTRYPKLKIVLAFTCGEVYVRFRAPVDHDFFYMTEPYDERLYSFFPLLGLIDHITGTAPLAKYAWLLSEWRVGTVWRQKISAAYKSGDQERVNQVMAGYGLQRFRPRNGLPLLRDV